MNRKLHHLNHLVWLALLLVSFIPGIHAQNTERVFLSAEESGQSLKVTTSDGFIVFKPYSQSGMEVEFLPKGEANPPSYAIGVKPEKTKTVLTQTDHLLKYTTGGLEVTIEKVPFKVSYSYNHHPLFSEEHGYFQNDTLQGFRFNLSPEEKLMGGGERVLGMDRRGHRLQLYNKASYGYETHADLMYYSMPVVISSKKYMVVFDNGASGFMDLGATQKDILQFEAVGGRMSYLVVAGDAWDQLAENYTGITGRQPMVPRWALGNIASRMGYHTQQEVEDVVDKYIADDIPLDGIVLDLYWFGPDLKGHMGNLEWDLDSFPEPEKMMADIKKKGVKTVLITEPFILKKSGKYAECVEKGLLGTDTLGNPYVFDFFFGTTTLLDIFKPSTQRWFWNIYKKHTLSGVAGWWGDLGEPEVHPDDLMHVNGRGDEVHNLYGHQWAKTVYEGFAKDFPERRPVILMRAGFAGSQRYGLVPWSGDVSRSWGGLKPQVEISLQMGMQGLAYMHSDLGGFAGNNKDAELYIRWLQYGVFQPVYRTHAQEDVPPEPVFWDEDTKDIVRESIKLRYALMPYNYTLIHENATKGLPMMRPLFYVDDNPALLDNTEAYLWGDNFLVAPVVNKGVTTKKMYIPDNGVWMDYFNKERYAGGQEVEVPVDINHIPVFVKAGSFIPMVPPMQSTDDYHSEKLFVHYYNDNSVEQADGYMYEDDGATKGSFEKKAYEIIRFKSIKSDDKLLLTISPDGYDYQGKPDQRNVYMVVENWNAKPSKVYVDGDKVKVQKRSDKLEKLSEGAFWDSVSGQLTIKVEMADNVKTIVIE
ncbi:DUF5110 domain-containing protein [Marinilabiliaceae bacterium JC017]|nr:DUF5110 domain-containing protein [Marinilabiliaceae bacterium JC017]